MNPSASANDGHQPRQSREQNGWNGMDNMINPDRAINRAISEPFRLNFTDVTCLVINRTIGTGVFNGPQGVINGVKSPGLAILLWVCGCVYGLSGTHVFLEYGLNVPRYIIDGVEQSVPRSGGELHYLQYVFSWPRYKGGTVMLSGVLFGISFIFIGNMASNCIHCAQHLMQAARPDMTPEELGPATIRGIAILIAGGTCFIHAFSRRGGILLNNAFAIVKVLILLSIIIATWVVAGRESGVRGVETTTGTSSSNTPYADSEPIGAPQAFLSVAFAFFGFDQPSHVLGEVKNPRKNLARSMWWGMGIVSVLYIGVNICFMIIVPRDSQMVNNVAIEFFNIICKSDVRGKQAINAFLAISSFGNIVVWTFTAARMKREIAKQGFIPFPEFFAHDQDFSLGRLLDWFENKSRRRVWFINPANHREETPVGALILHFLSCLVLIAATWGIGVEDAYNVLIRIFTYIIAACFGVLLSLGILILHFRGPPPTEVVEWRTHHGASERRPVHKPWGDIIKDTVNAKVSIACALLYLAGSLYPIFMYWVPPLPGSTGVAWYVVPLASWCVLAVSTIWFFGFLAIVRLISRITQNEFVLERGIQFDQAEPERLGAAADSDLPIAEASSRSGFIILKEEFSVRWRAKEMDDFANSMGGQSIELQDSANTDVRDKH